MRIITTIHLAIGFILLTFMVVTLGYLKQTKGVKQNISQVLYTSNIIREGESAQKLLLDMETGLRGYLLTGEKSFLTPYYTSRSNFKTSLLFLDSLTKKTPVLNSLVHSIERDREEWVTRFAEPLIAARNKVGVGPVFKIQYDSLFSATVQQGKGKAIIDRARRKFEKIEVEEEILKHARIQEMDSSISRVNDIAIGLTFLAVLVGSITAFLLGRTISKRFTRLNALANSIAQGNYNVMLADGRHDEISGLTHSMNLMAHKLQESFNHLTKVNQELDQFAYVVSHDLKAPLRAIHNLAEWIAEDLETKDPDIIKNLTILRGRVLRMENLINGILEYSKIGKKEMATSTFSVRDIVQETVENLSPPPSFKIKVVSDLPTMVGEKTLMYQVFSNLLGNAIKYHDKPEGTVEIKATEVAGFYRFEIKDDGPGIPKEFHQKVFGMFQTMAARDVKESTGVGLAIVKKIIEEKGGEIWIDSDQGRGATFLFTWPKTPVAKKAFPIALPS